MSRKCFLSDNDGHYYAVEVDRKGFFTDLLDACYMLDEDESTENQEQFEEEFGSDRLNMHISNYSFDDLQEMD